ncbi:hypothetical protein BC830DRAFT_1170984 [Chytriomyces sp. MP71]|nr:hypothetical protein BC830DRAFT_1170984 [Chytriomyces sp. MP71]
MSLTITRALGTALALETVSLLLGLSTFVGGASSNPPFLAQIAFISFATTASTTASPPKSGINRVKLTTWGACYLTLDGVPTCKPLQSGLFASGFKFSANLALNGDPKALVTNGNLDPVDAASLLPFTVNPIAFLSLAAGLLLSFAALFATAASLHVTIRNSSQMHALTSLTRLASILSIAATLLLGTSITTSLFFSSAVNSLITREFSQFNISTTVSLYAPAFLGFSSLLSICASWLTTRSMIIAKRERTSRPSNEAGASATLARDPFKSGGKVEDMASSGALRNDRLPRAIDERLRIRDANIQAAERIPDRDNFERPTSQEPFLVQKRPITPQGPMTPGSPAAYQPQPAPPPMSPYVAAAYAQQQEYAVRQAEYMRQQQEAEYARQQQAAYVQQQQQQLQYLQHQAFEQQQAYEQAYNQQQQMQRPQSITSGQPPKYATRPYQESIIQDTESSIAIPAPPTLPSSNFRSQSRGNSASDDTDSSIFPTPQTHLTMTPVPANKVTANWRAIADGAPVSAAKLAYRAAYTEEGNPE